MDYLSRLFFFLSPFALFCSGGGNGLILCPLFIILGFVFKWIGKGGLEPKIKVEPQDWWETNYKINMAQRRGHESSRAIADWSTNVNHCHMPTEEEKERIARSMGVITPQMKYDEEDRWNRIQVEKYRLMDALCEKYKNKRISSPDYIVGKRVGRECYPYMYIDGSKRVLKNHIEVYRWNKDPWGATLSEDEKNEAQKWIEEYEERLLKEVNDYIENGIDMPTITKHKDRGGWAVYNDFDVEYGFCRKIGKQYENK